MNHGALWGQDRTEWFPAHIKPTRPGLYQISEGPNRFWAWWNGQHWLSCTVAYETASVQPKAPLQNKVWRGLLFDYNDFDLRR
jgi:hypothetical protein